MEKQLKDEDLNKVTGGRSPRPMPSAATREVCAICHAQFTGDPLTIRSLVEEHMKTTNHTHFVCYYD